MRAGLLQKESGRPGKLLDEESERLKAEVHGLMEEVTRLRQAEIAREYMKDGSEKKR